MKMSNLVDTFLTRPWFMPLPQSRHNNTSFWQQHFFLSTFLVGVEGFGGYALSLFHRLRV